MDENTCRGSPAASGAMPNSFLLAIPHLARLLNHSFSQKTSLRRESVALQRDSYCWFFMLTHRTFDCLSNSFGKKCGQHARVLPAHHVTGIFAGHFVSNYRAVPE